MQVSTVAQQLGITAGRLNTIAAYLFNVKVEGQKVEFTPEDIEKIDGVVKVIRLHNERSVKKAVELYQQGIAAETRVDPRANLQQSTSTAGKTGGLSSSMQTSQQMAVLLAEREVAAILETKNNLVADWLMHGIPVNVISQESLDRLEISAENVYAATLGKIDAVGNYLPALVQNSGRMLSAAVED